MDTVPTTIKDWYKRAMHFKTQWERTDAIAHKQPYNLYPTQKSHASNHQNLTPNVNPYVMDVDSIHIEKLTPQERGKCIKENHCL